MRQRRYTTTFPTYQPKPPVGMPASGGYTITLNPPVATQSLNPNPHVATPASVSVVVAEHDRQASNKQQQHDSAGHHPVRSILSSVCVG